MLKIYFGPVEGTPAPPYHCEWRVWETGSSCAGHRVIGPKLASRPFLPGRLLLGLGALTQLGGKPLTARMHPPSPLLPLLLLPRPH